MRSKRLRMFDDAWRWFSKYVRLRDNNICFTCGRIYPIMNAGHFIHKSQTSDTYFDEMNVNCQCQRCNNDLNGNLDRYTINLIQKYGLKKILILDKRRYLTKQWNLEELTTIRDKYKKKVEKILTN